MMIAHKTDPLLLIAKIACLIFQVLMAFGAVVLVLVVGAITLFGADALQSGAIEGLPESFPRWGLVAIMLIGLGIIGCSYFFADRLRRIIATVGEGDPFQPLNATRLAQMAWSLLGVQALVWLAVPIALMLERYADASDRIEVDGFGALDVSGLLLAVLLFILARVFRHGTNLREEVEGTI